ncbi:MAG: malonyl-CoA decarboxylase family protein, partial [Candidatus Bathyarchaeia archaeon]
IQRHDIVHPLTSLEEMGQRLGNDTRCFALYHRAMAEEPVVFIEVALTKGIIRSIHQIIDKEPGRERRADNFDTAIFYSINNTQEGLTGIGLGKVMIFQVVDHIKKTVPSVQTFSTLSPIPGFWKNYLKRILEGNDSSFLMKREGLLGYFTEKSRLALEREFRGKGRAEPKDFGEVLLGILSDKRWIENPVYIKYLQKPMEEITYFYITKEKGHGGKPLNPVANFHMANGATVSKNCINFLGNRSQRGLEESCGMMVNYIYSQSWFQQIKRSLRNLFSST